jgi:peptidoglycan/LPS O-acetylase OafA/YrhL
MEQKKTQLQALTGIRFFFAIYIVVFHYSIANSLNGLPQIFKNLIHNGYSGVSLFFVLSGFVLAYNYSDAKATILNNSKRFWFARFARIYPLYLIALLVSLPGFVNRIFEATDLPKMFTLVFTPLLIQAWTPWTSCQWNCPGWAVSTEVLCYALFPIISAHLFKQNKNKLLLLSLATWLIGLVAPSLYAVWLSRLQSADLWLRFIIYSPVFHLPQFVIGVITGILFLRQFQGSFDRLSPSLNSSKIGKSFVVLVCLLVLFLFFDIQYVFINNGLIAPLFALLIYALSFEKSKLTYMLSLPCLTFLGETSYAIYLMHLPVNSLTKFIGTKFGYQETSSFDFIMICILILVVVSILLFLFVEQPARKQILSFLQKRTAN